ncbi:MAG: M20/M25/M40 family metallo-hydrolase [Phycisphaeraceae bacterium]
MFTERQQPRANDLKLLHQLLALPTSPFHEQNVAAFAWTMAARLGWHVRVDRFGNLRLKPTARTRPKLVLTAHLDHPGFWALAMEDDQTLMAHWMGGVPAEVMPGQAVRFWTGGRKLPEGAPGPWCRLGSEARLGGAVVDGRVKEIVELGERGTPTLVRITVKKAVTPGSIGMWRLGDPVVHDGRVFARAVDDVAAVAALLATARRLNRLSNKPDVEILLTRAEEGGFFGAIDYCRGIRNPERAPVHVGLEMSSARSEVPVGSGVVIRVGDRRMTYDPGVADWENATAQALAAGDAGFRFQRQLMTGGSCESTVYQTYLGRAGALCLPLGNYHNVDRERKTIAPEFIDLADFRDLVELCVALAKQPFSDKVERGDSFRAWCEVHADRHANLTHDPVGIVEPLDG